MSVVTTLVLTTSIMEGSEQLGRDTYPAIQHLNAWFGAEVLRLVNDHAGGNKAPQAEVFMAAMNHLDLDGLKEAMRNAPWAEPDAVLLLVNEEHDDGFHVENWR